jgi:hypothetical protein
VIPLFAVSGWFEVWKPAQRVREKCWNLHDLRNGKITELFQLRVRRPVKLFVDIQKPLKGREEGEV